MIEKKTYPLNVLRALAIHAQGLDQLPKSKPDAEAIYSTIEKIGWVQIDTLQMVHRAQYVTMWSRLGSYDIADFDSLMFDGGNTAPDNGRKLFEYWMHAACIIPFTHYRHRIPQMRNYRNGKSGWRREWGNLPENIELMDKVMAHIRDNGGARPADFEDRKKRRGTWWAWDSTKLALEHLYNQGDLAISNRVKFQRIYDIPERVLPHWVDTTEPTEEESHRHLLENGMKAQGVCTPAQVGDYFHMKRNDSRPIIEQLIKDGTFVQIEGELADGSSANLVVHRDNMPLLEKAADGALTPRHTTFLTPFDSLFWAKDRDLQFWNFRQILEAYKPEPIREWGYFCLPILHNDKLVGRFDPKLERKTKTLRLKKLYLEPGVRPTNKLASSVAKTMHDFMAFHNATDLVIEHSQPADLGPKIMAAL